MVFRSAVHSGAFSRRSATPFLQYFRGNAPLMLRCTAQSELTRAIMELPPTGAVNSFRKQHGNVQQVLRVSRIGRVFTVDGSVLRVPDPLPAYADVEGLVSRELYERAASILAEIAQQRRLHAK